MIKSISSNYNILIFLDSIYSLNHISLRSIASHQSQQINLLIQIINLLLIFLYGFKILVAVITLIIADGRDGLRVFEVGWTSSCNACSFELLQSFSLGSSLHNCLLTLPDALLNGQPDLLDCLFHIFLGFGLK